MKTGGQLGRRHEAGQKKKPGQKSRHGVLLSRPGACAGERAPRVERGMRNVTKLEGSRAKHRLQLPCGGVLPAGCSMASCLVESGLHDSGKWNGASRSGGNESA